MENSNYTIGNRTRDLPPCNVVPQPTANYYRVIYLIISREYVTHREQADATFYHQPYSGLNIIAQFSQNKNCLTFEVTKFKIVTQSTPFSYKMKFHELTQRSANSPPL